MNRMHSTTGTGLSFIPLQDGTDRTRETPNRENPPGRVCSLPISPSPSTPRQWLPNCLSSVGHPGQTRCGRLNLEKPIRGRGAAWIDLPGKKTSPVNCCTLEFPRENMDCPPSLSTFPDIRDVAFRGPRAVMCDSGFVFPQIYYKRVEYADIVTIHFISL